MRFLIDENVPSIFVDWLRSQGYDLVLAGDLAPGETDIHWLGTADGEQRIILTSDKDFGELIFRDKLNSHGVILIRLFDLAVTERLVRLQQVWSVIEANPSGSFIVVTSNRVRVRKLNP